MKANLFSSRIGGTAAVPPSKSAAHRAVLCAALAEGTSRIENIEYSQDIRATLGAVAQLGAKVTEEPHAVSIQGRGAGSGFVTVTRPVFLQRERLHPAVFDSAVQPDGAKNPFYRRRAAV